MGLAAISKKHLDALHLLLKAGADPNGGVGTITPVSCAMDEDNKVALTLLMEAKADANRALEDGPSPMLRAAENDNAEAMEILLIAKGDANSCGDGISPVLAATK